MSERRGGKRCSVKELEGGGNVFRLAVEGRGLGCEY
jgi:hypothetical protein